MEDDMNLAGRPPTVKEISDQAADFTFDASIPLKAWLRTAQTLSQEGNVYLEEQNFGKAYLLFLRYSILFAYHLNKHPQASTPEGKKLLKTIKKQAPLVLATLEQIKPFVEAEHEQWKESQERDKKLRDAQKQEQASSKVLSGYEQQAVRDPALSFKARILDAGENQDLAVDLAQREFLRRTNDKLATRQAGISREEEQKRRVAGLWDNWRDELAEKQATEEEYFRRQMESTRRQLDGDQDSFRSRINRQSQDGSRPSMPHASSTSFHYPSVSRSEPVRYEPEREQSREENRPRPARPPKESLPPLPGAFGQPSAAPQVPAKENLYFTPAFDQEPPARPAKTKDISELPAAPPKPQKQRTTFKPAAYLENGEPMRSLFIPTQLRTRFLEIAAENTRKGIEMCGILCGTAVNNALFVQCLVIPEQKCTSDTCETENEDALLNFCIEEDLLNLGWIHTHPTQTCFMSSRDLHTQAGYQVMLPESIAVVCAPRYNDFGIFRLTHPPGLSHILHCNQSTTFHQHTVDDLYKDAFPTGHVFESNQLDFYVQDLRPGFEHTNRNRGSDRAELPSHGGI